MELVNPNLAGLERTAKALESILPELVFVGGSIAGLLLNDPGASAARVTKDVDVVAQIAGRQGYLWASRTMHDLGFEPDTSEGAPICRWVREDLLVDLMGTEESLFGESNPWYGEGLSTKVPHTLPTTGLEIFILSAPVFLLTKWVAFQSRGKGDPAASHDIEDLLIVMDGRLGLVEEARTSSGSVRAGLRAMAERLMDSEAFVHHCLPSLEDREEVVQGVLASFMAI